jgi:hypothetical protein
VNAHLFGQGLASMNAPSKELERLVLDRRIDHGPVLSHFPIPKRIGGTKTPKMRINSRI